MNELDYRECSNWPSMKLGCGTTRTEGATTNNARGMLDNRENGPRDAYDLPYDIMLMVTEDFTGIGLYIAKVASHVGHDDTGTAQV